MKATNRKRFTGLLLAMLMLLSAFGLLLSGCGGEEGPPNPNIGIWKAEKASLAGIEVDIDDVFPDGGIQIELKAKGKATLTLEGEDYRAKWSLEDGVLSLGDSSVTMTGTIEGDVMVLDNLMNSGIDVTFVKAS